MDTLKFKTNVQCGGCISSVAPYLNKIKEIAHWEVNTQSPDKILSVRADSLSAKTIIDALGNAGYQASQI